MRKIKQVIRHTLLGSIRHALRRGAAGLLMSTSLVSGLGAGCIIEGGGVPREEDPPAAKTRDRIGHVRAMHLARSAPVLSLTHDGGAPMVDALAFRGLTDHLPMGVGAHGFDVALRDSGEQMASSDDLSLSEGERWSLLVWGDPNEMHATLLADAIGSGYRIVHAVPGGERIAARLVGAGGAEESASLEPGESTAVIGEDAGDTLEVDADGDGAPDATFTIPDDADDGAATDLFLVANDDASNVSLLACTPDGLVEVPANEAPPEPRVRAIHLSPNAPPVDVFVSGARALANLAFPGMTPYAYLPIGTYDFDIAPAGAPIEDTVLSVDGLSLTSGRSYSAVAYGALPNIRALALEDDVAPAAAGNIRVRAAHTAEGVGQVDVLAIGETNTLVYDDVDFGAVSDFIEIPAAAITLGLDLDDDLSPELVFDVPALPVGTIATLFAVLGADGPFLFAATDNAGSAVIPGAPPAPPAPPANVRVVHLSPDAPAVSVSANATQIVQSVSFYGATPFVEIAAGATDLDIALASDPTAPILSLTDAELAPGSATTAVAYGRAAELQVLAIAEDLTPPADGQIRLRPVHTAVGVGDVDLYVVTDTGNVKIVDDLAFGSAADALEVPAGAYTLALDVNEDTHVDLTFHLPHVAAGTIANVFAVTDAHGNASLAVQH